MDVAQLLNLISENQEKCETENQEKPETQAPEEAEVKVDHNRSSDDLMKLLLPLLNTKNGGGDSWKKGIYKVIKPFYGMHMIFSCNKCRDLQFQNKDKYEKQGDVIIFKLPMRQCCVEANMKITDIIAPTDYNSNGNNWNGNYGQKRKYGE
jgi:hypothetical protein